MENVGRFLEKLLVNHTLPRCRPMALNCSVDTTHLHSHQILHFAPNYKQSQLVRLVVYIYGGVPESFEVFHCKSSSTQDELSLFLDRVERRPLNYLLLEVNKLSVILQEVNKYTFFKYSTIIMMF